jgi:hypothetical protein
MRFAVGVCELNKDGREWGGKARPLVAYTRPYNMERLCRHEVEAVNGTKAKQAAMREHRTRCMATGTEG